MKTLLTAHRLVQLNSNSVLSDTTPVRNLGFGLLVLDLYPCYPRNELKFQFGVQLYVAKFKGSVEIWPPGGAASGTHDMIIVE